MATVVSQPEFDLRPHGLTAADVAALPMELPSGPIDYELDNGELVIMSPPGRRHGRIQGRIGAEFVVQGEKQGHGEAYIEVGIVLWREPDRVVGADNAFVAAASLPSRESPEGYLATIPDIVVEVKSKNDTSAYMARKIEHYLQAGVKVVWNVDPESKTIEIHQPGGEVKILTENDTLTMKEIIPDFEMNLAELFRD